LFKPIFSLPSFPRKRESTLALHSGESRNHFPCPSESILARHSRESGNPFSPSFGESRNHFLARPNPFLLVIPAKAGIQFLLSVPLMQSKIKMDSRFRGNDVNTYLTSTHI
jgi:hypothetical protein